MSGLTIKIPARSLERCGRAFLLLEFHKFQFVSGYSPPSFAVGDFDIHNIRADLRWTCFNRNDLQKHAKQIDK